MRTVLLFLVVVLVARCWSEDCVPRDYGNGGTVCVCNATYCDTVPPLPTFLPRHYVYYTSSKDGLRFNLTKKNFGVRRKARGLQIVINTNVTYQTIQGFGGAFTDSAGINILSLSPGAQDNLLKSYFSENGTEYTLGRVPIGGCDFSPRPYTYDDDEVGDALLKNFSLASEDFNYKIPIITRAKEMSNRTINLLSAAWSSPTWMKTNNDLVGFGLLKEEYYRAWANYHIKFLDEYKKNGIDFWGMSTGNEPINGIIPFMSFNSLGWTPSSQQEWISHHLGPMLRNSTHSNIKLMVLDDQRFFLPWWPNILLEEEDVSKYIDGIAVHWYWDNIFPSSLLERTHSNFPNKFLLSTEACIGDKPWDRDKVLLGSWSRGEMYSDDIIDNLSHWVTGWVDWNLALNLQGGPNWAENYVDSAMIVNATSDEFYKQPTYYTLGHFAKFVPPGSVRVDIQPANDRVKAVAFKTPDELVVIVLSNKKSTDQAITISGPPRGFINIVVPRRSIITLLYRDKKAPLI